MRQDSSRINMIAVENKYESYLEFQSWTAKFNSSSIASHCVLTRSENDDHYTTRSQSLSLGL